MNLDLRSVCNWLKANKISLNASKTEMLVFRDPRRKIDFDLKIKIDGKKITPSKFVKYLGIYLDNFLSWQKQEQDMRSRLSRAAGMLCKIRHYVDFDTLKMVYYGIFASILNYGSLIWGQHSRIVNRLQTIQNRAIKYMTFKPKRTTVLPLFKKSEILNLEDYVVLQNCLFAHDCINDKLPTPLLDDRIMFVETSGNTRAERLNQLVNFRTKTVLYGSNSIKSRAVKAWNDVNTELHHLKLQDESKSICKKRIYEHLLNKYPGSNGNITNNRINNRNNNNRNRNNNNKFNNNNNNNGIQVLQWRRPNHAQLRAIAENRPQFASRWDNQLRNF